MAIVLLTECTNSFKAEVIKGALEAEGIPCVIQGDSTNLIYGGINAAPVRILVEEEDLDAAVSLLKENNEE